MNKRLIFDVFENSAKANLERTAIIDSNGEYTYSELLDKVNELSLIINSISSSQSSNVVSTLFSGSAVQVYSLISILKSGNIYFPLSTKFGKRQWESVFIEVKPKILITSKENHEILVKIQKQFEYAIPYIILINEENRCGEIQLYKLLNGEYKTFLNFKKSSNNENKLEGEEGCYLYFTSGSTGIPKLILGKHKSLSHFIHWETEELKVNNSVRVAQLTSMVFDASLRDIFLPLISGGCLCIPTKECKEDFSLLTDWLKDNKINVVHMVPSVFRMFILTQSRAETSKKKSLPNLDFVLLAGESLYCSDIKSWQDTFGGAVTFYNLYGATESTLVKTFYKIPKNIDCKEEVIPVGRPIKGALILILNKKNEICKLNEVGEVYIKTPYLTRGYFNKEMLTNLSFVQNPLNKDGKDIIYKTGDKGKYIQNRNIVILGRIDDVVKVNGVRIDLKDIECVVKSFEGVNQVKCLITNSDKGNKLFLCYYSCNKKNDISVDEMKEKIRSTISSQERPNKIIRVDKMPLNQNGKIDKKALLRISDRKDVKVLQNLNQGLLKQVKSIWCEVLGVNKDLLSKYSDFFEMGGNSLKAIELLGLYHKKFHVRISMQQIYALNCLEDHLQLINESNKTVFEGIKSIKNSMNYELSDAQRRIWVLSQFSEGSVAYNMPSYVEFDDTLDIDSFKKAIESTIHRHEILRTIFKQDENGGIRQWVLPLEQIKYNIDLQKIEERDYKKYITDYIKNDIEIPFNLEKGPLFRTTLFNVLGNKFIFYYNIHHIIGDGWSMKVLANDIFSFYDSYKMKKEINLPDLKIQYKDYAAWQLMKLASEEFIEHKKYWVRKLAGELSSFKLPFQKDRPKFKSFKGKKIVARLPIDYTAKVKNIYKGKNGTAFVFFAAVWKILYYSYTFEKDIIIGSPVSGRKHPDLESQIGFYVNSIVLRSEINPQQSFNSFLDDFKKNFVESIEHQMYPFDRLVEDLKLKRDLSRSPIFDVMIAFHDFNNSIEGIKEYDIDLDKEEVTNVKFDIGLTFSFIDNYTLIELKFNSDLYDVRPIKALLEKYVSLVSLLLYSPDKMISEIPSSLGIELNVSQKRSLSILDKNQDNINDGKSLYVAPSDAVELELVEIWSEVLGIPKEKVGVYDDFFELGGHSLNAMSLISIFKKNFGVKIKLSELFTHSVLLDQSDLLNRSSKTTYYSIVPVEEKECYRLSSSQRRLWVLSQFTESSRAYNMSGVYEFEGWVDIEILERSLEKIVRRHEVLRTVFKGDEQGEVRQYVKTFEDIGFKLRYEDLSGEEEVENKVKDKVQQEVDFLFDLERGPLLRALLLDLGGSRYIFSYVIHHIISDGWSMGLLIMELMQVYNNKGEDTLLKELPIQYKDYSEWQQKQLSGVQLKVHQSYWLSQFEGELPVLEFPSDRMRPAIKTYRGGVVNKQIGIDLLGKLNGVLQKQGCTLYMGLLGLVNVLLYRYTGQEDIILGSPIAGRGNIDLEGQIGFYVNTLALRIRFNGEDSYGSLLKHVKDVTLGAYENEVYPFDELVDELHLERDLSRNALFDVMVVLQNATGVKEEELVGVKINQYKSMEHVVSKFDMTFNFSESQSGVGLSIGYNSDLYDKFSINRLGEHFLQILEQVVQHPEVSIKDIDYLRTEEKSRILEEFNNTERDYPRDKTIIELFEEQVSLSSKRIAVVYEDRELSYEELNRLSNQLGDYLRRNYGVDIDDLVGIKLERSEWMIVSMLGVLKSGGAYMPIDPDYPEQRISYMLEDSSCKVLIDEAELGKFRESMQDYSVNNLPKVNTSKDLIYVVYTSGSTGNPKGVMIENQGVVNHIYNIKDAYKLKEGNNFLQFFNIAFDAAAEEIFTSLCFSNTLYLRSKEDLGYDRLLDLINKNKINHADFPSGYFMEFITNIKEEDICHKLDSCAVGGDKLDLKFVQTNISIIKKLARKFFNVYGPTETTLTVTICDVFDDVNLNKVLSLPIGKPYPNRKILVVDKNEKLLPTGVPGEICIGGDGLARGYVNNRKLTDEKFISIGLGKLGDFYKTGDIGKFNDNGVLNFIGRVDDQVKHRGFRIELGEIEQVVASYPMVKIGIVFLSKINSVNELVCYLSVSREFELDNLKKHLKSKLPYYMIPSRFIIMDSMPLTSNGKIDRQKLQLVDADKSIEGNIIDVRNTTEKQIAEYWKEILGKDKIGVNQNFFAIGGNSIMAIRLIGKIKAEMNTTIDFKSVINNPTIEELAKVILANTWLNNENNQNSSSDEINSIII